MAFRRYEPLARHALVYVEFDEEENPKGVVDVLRHLRERYRSVSLAELHTFALEHNQERQRIYKEARLAYRQRTHRSASTRRDFQASEFASYNAMLYLNARTIGTVSRACQTLGDWFDRWHGSAEAGSVAYKLLLALYVRTEDPVLDLLFLDQDEDAGQQ